jgi:hypothetical protein
MTDDSLRAYTRDELLALTPARYLASGYLDGQGVARGELQTSFATAAATQLAEGELAPQELSFTCEALQQTLPEHGGPLPQRLVAALDEALEVVRGLIQQPNNVSLKSWMQECTTHVKTEAELEAFQGHLLAVLRQYTAIAAAPSR